MNTRKILIQDMQNDIQVALSPTPQDAATLLFDLAINSELFYDLLKITFEEIENYKAHKSSLGTAKGDVCNRNGCDGIIENDGQCNCHIHPPCSSCVDENEFCPKCGWDIRYNDDEKEVENG